MFTIRPSLEFLLEKLGKNSKLSLFLKFVLLEKLCCWESALRGVVLIFTAFLGKLCRFAVFYRSFKDAVIL